MAFHFKIKESPPRATRRLTRERIGKALEHLQNSDRLENVHSVRKEIKKVRATLALVHNKMDESSYRKYAKTLRAAAKCLTDPRDARVRLRTLDRLVVHFKDQLPARPFGGIKRALRQNCLEETREFMKGGSSVQVGGMLRKLSRRTRGLKVRAEGWAAIQSGLKESYSRGRDAFEMALEETASENLHQWRKHVQDLWYQLRLLCPIRPESLHVAAGEMKMLSQYLGDDHDLAVLMQFVVRRCIRGYPEEVRLLNKLIELRQKELQSAALALGSRFYMEKPSQFCRRIENYWRNWYARKKSKE